MRWIDAHHHLWDTFDNNYPYLQNGSRDRMHGLPLPRRYLIEDYLSDIDGSDVRASVHIQCGWDPSDPAGETKWLDAIAEQHDLPSAIVGHVDLASEGVAGELEAHLVASERIRGIRQHVGWHANPRYRLGPRPDMLEEPAWLAGYAMLGRYNLSFDLQAYYQQLPAAMAVAAHYPDTPILLGNSGMPIDRGSEKIVEWRSAIRKFASVPNTYIKIGGFAMFEPNWTSGSMKPLVDFLVEAFGPSRCIVGSNFPVERLHKSYFEVSTAFDELFSGYSDAERKEIFQGTASRVYRI